MRLRLVIAACAAWLGCGALAQDTPALRVCADPDNLPYSRMDGTGFEDRIARLISDELHLPLRYEWLPDRRGFVRKTMGAGLCDVIMGVPAGFERTATTRPYYRSSYVIVDRADAGAPIRSFDDERLARLRLGVQLIGSDLAASPPGHALARHGHATNVRGFAIPGDKPAVARIVESLERSELDAAFVWGPQAGFFARHARIPLRITLIAAPADLEGQPFEFAISVGVRRGNAKLLAQIDEALLRRQPDIQRILDEYGVPRIKETER